VSTAAIGLDLELNDNQGPLRSRCMETFESFLNLNYEINDAIVRFSHAYKKVIIKVPFTRPFLESLET